MEDYYDEEEKKNKLKYTKKNIGTIAFLPVTI